MKYDAFISYRHSELDMYVAKKVHKGLETFKVPRSVRKKSGKKSIKRVFRDQEELPIGSDLNDNISAALEGSEYLLVICSPRAKESYWVEREISSFISMHDREHVLAILIEGEPDESFPAQLLVDENGKAVEPLAADVRGKTKSEINKKMKTELMRLAAPLLSCTYDDLKQRHRERKMRKAFSFVAAIGAIVAGLGIAFGLYNAKMANEIQQNYTEKQISQAKYLADTSLDLTKIGDRRAAALVALSAIPQGDDDKPYVTEAEYALSKALYAYDDGSRLKLEKVINHDLPVSMIEVNEDGSYITTVDRNYTTFVWETETSKKVLEIPCKNLNYVTYANVIDDKLIIVGKTDYRVLSLDGTELFYRELDYVRSAKAYPKDSWIAISSSQELVIFDAVSLTETAKFYPEGVTTFASVDGISVDGRYVACSMYTEPGSATGMICVCDLEAKTAEFTSTVYDYIADISIYPNKDIVVVSYSSDNLFSGLDYTYVMEYKHSDKTKSDFDWTQTLTVNSGDRNETYSTLKTAEIGDTSYLLYSVGNNLYSYDRETGEIIYTIGVNGKVSTFWLGGNSFIYTASYDGKISFFNADSGKLYYDNTINTDKNILFCRLAGGRFFFSSKGGGDITILGYVNPAFLLETVPNDNNITDIIVSPDEETVAKISAPISGNVSLYFYSASDDTLESTCEISNDEPIRDLLFLNDETFAIIDFDANLHVIDVKTGNCRVYEAPNIGVVQGTVISKENRMALAYRNDAYFSVNLDNYTYSSVITTDHNISSLIPAGNSVGYGTNDDGLFSLDLNTGKFDFDYPKEYVATSSIYGDKQMVINNDGKLLGLCCEDGYLRILNTESRETLNEIPFSNKSHMELTFTKDSNFLLMEGDDNIFRVFDLQKNEFAYISTELTNIFSEIYETENEIVLKSGYDLRIISKENFSYKAYVERGLDISFKYNKIYALNSYDVYNLHYATLDELIEEADRQFPDAELTDYEKIKYHVE